MESITKIAQTTYPMNIVIAHFNTHWVDNPGGVEKSTCQLANALRERGHKVTILYRDGREGPPYFPLDESIPVDNILFENGKKVISDKLPPLYRMARELPASSDKIMLRESMQNTRESNMVRQLKDVLRIFIRISSYQPRFHQLNTF